MRFLPNLNFSRSLKSHKARTLCNFVYSLQEIAEEAPLHIPEQDPPKEWPQHGVVKFDNYQTRYRPGLDLVLKGKAWDICFLCHTVVRWFPP